MPAQAADLRELIGGEQPRVAAVPVDAHREARDVRRHPLVEDGRVEARVGKVVMLVKGGRQRQLAARSHVGGLHLRGRGAAGGGESQVALGSLLERAGDRRVGGWGEGGRRRAGVRDSTRAAA